MLPVMEAGFAKLEITPPPGLPMAGAFFPRPIEGVLDPLHAHAAVLQAADTRVALVSCDVVALKHSTVKEVRERVERTLGIPVDNVAVFATHTHTGPYTKTFFGHHADPGYVASLTTKIVEAIESANERMQPVEVGVASALEPTISFNRRYVMQDGRVRTHPNRGSSDLVCAEGPIDPEVGVVCFRGSADGEIGGCLVTFACHPNVVRGTLVSADFPGALGRALARRLGSSCITLFGNGSSGDICQIDVQAPDRGDSGPGWAERMGAILADRSVEAIDKMAFAADPPLVTASRIFELRLRDPDATPYHGTMFGGETWKEVDENYAVQQEELRRVIRKRPTVPFEIQVVRIGGAALVMFPVELFAALGLEIKRRAPLQPTLVVTHANGAYGYVPTRQAFDRGGYEVRTGWNSMFVPEAGDQIVAAAVELLAELQ